MFILYLFSFLTTYLGFILGKITLEEHKQIKDKVLVLSDVLKLIFYIFAIYFSKDFNLIYLFGFMFLLFIASKYFKNEKLVKIHDISLLALSIFAFSVLDEKIYIILLIVFAIIFENSFRKFNWKEELGHIALYLVIYGVYLLL